MREPKHHQLAKDLRRRSTDAESVLWYHLRARRLGGHKFRRQYPVGRFILDFYCPASRLAIELDGGGHAEPEQIEGDALRTKTLEGYGIRVLRFWNHDVLARTEVVLGEILRVLEGLSLEGKTPSP